MKKQEIINYFTQNLNPIFRNWIGTEIETHFVNQGRGTPITKAKSQEIFYGLTKKGWLISMTKGGLITELTKDGSRILYELGRQNIEFASTATPYACLWPTVMKGMKELYDAAYLVGAEPLFEPIIITDEDLLVIPDERDASWLLLDGKSALSLLTKAASLQFTIETKDVKHAIQLLNYFADRREDMLNKNPYPQEKLWKEYIISSYANYRSDRYGIVRPQSIEEYVDLLAQHDVVENGKLVPFEQGNQKIELFLRSIWWNFRLRRYADYLCIEIRTLPRRTDSVGEQDLNFIHELMALSV